ncbi:efflux RND transporter periplasmic adaptor subunit [Aliiroseovarius sp. S1339]|uniref:efflux RND transporter periplasmic adaptor subunit n=1 Tax=Aliiroseovarius sp. S1339 TaxID=2936990 RepID=UPI0020BDD2FD|nr:efflux RND transporter periplasmic adaptor subunit [Aliiroseovarius sp. S1339]MCK8464462.1 efflux RND transporter periplasmic adaptor subunit [Aliiroseovarius sp. S1339]
MRIAILIASLLTAGSAWAETLTLAETSVTEWKAVYGRVEARETVPARARIGGLVVELSVTEGDLVKSGQQIALVGDDKIVFQIAALEAQITAFKAQLSTAESELLRGQELVDRGVATVQRLDQLRTVVDVLRSQIATAEAQRDVITQQATEGGVLAPGEGRVLSVPATLGAVILPGEPIALIGGGGFFLRLAIPERHATSLAEGAEIRMHAEGADIAGRVAKLYPQIENGRVIADVEFEKLDTAFVNSRVLVELPVGKRMTLLVPEVAVETRSGIDFVVVMVGDDRMDRAVVLGEPIVQDGAAMVEVLSGLAPGDIVVTP